MWHAHPKLNYCVSYYQNQGKKHPRDIVSASTPTNGMMKPKKIGFPESLGPSYTKLQLRACRKRLFLEIAQVPQVNIDENHSNLVIMFY